MSVFDDGAARKLQLKFEDVAKGIVHRRVSSSLSIDGQTKEWVVNLRFTNKLRHDELVRLEKLTSDAEIKVTWLDGLSPSRLAVG